MKKRLLSNIFCVFSALCSLSLHATEPDSLRVSSATAVRDSLASFQNAPNQTSSLSSNSNDKPVPADSTKAVKRFEWFLGGKIAFDSYTDKYTSEDGTSSYSETTNLFGISPKFGFFVDDKMLFAMGIWYNTKIEPKPKFVSDVDYLQQYVPEDNTTTITNSLSFEPHFRYKVKTFKSLNNKVALWMELRPSFSIDWIKSDYLDNLVQELRYGVRLAPIITFKLNEKVYIETALDLLAISWQGSSIDQTIEISYDGKKYEVPVKYSTSNFGFSYGMNARSIARAIVSVGIIRKF